MRRAKTLRLEPTGAAARGKPRERRTDLVREIRVLVENLTEAHFELCARHVEEGCPEVWLPPVIQRAAKLRWTACNESFAVAAEYECVGGKEAMKGCRLVLAATLPTEKDWLPTALSWFSGGSAGHSARFFAALRQHPGQEQQIDLASVLASAGNVSGRVCREGVEWLPARCMANELEVRLRLLPRTSAPADSPAPVLRTASSALLGEAQDADESELQRLEGYRKIVQALNGQASRMETQADGEPMNLSRLRDLPEKARMDLLLLVLTSLLQRRQQVLSRWAAEAERPDATSGSGNDFMKALSSMRDNVRAIPGVLSGEQQAKEEEALVLLSVLTDHAELVHRALASLLGFDGGEKGQKVARLVETYTRCEPDCRPDLPDLAELCSAVRDAVEDAGSGLEAEDVPPPLSKEGCWVLGSESAVARYLKRAPFLDFDLAPSTEAAVAKLNLEHRTCPEHCCLTYLPHCGLYGVLYRQGQHSEALEQLGAASEAALAVGPRELQPQRVEDFMEGRRNSSDASAEPDYPPPIPRLWLAARDLLAMLLGAGDGAFDARSRAAFLELFARLGVPPRLMVRWEAEIGGALFEVLETSNIVAQQNDSQKTWNRGKVALAAATGGILLAVTGGLAAPAVAAGVSAIGTTAASAGAALGLAQAGAALGTAIAAWGAALASLGTAGAAVLFGATGAGITGWKLSRRWGDLEEFSFHPLCRSTRWVHTVVEISDRATQQHLDAVLRFGGSKLHEDLVLQDATGTTVALPKGLQLVRSGFLPRSGSQSNTLAAAAAAAGTPSARGGPGSRRTSFSYVLGSPAAASAPAVAAAAAAPPGAAAGGSGNVVRYDFQREVDKLQRAVHLAIFVSGWLQDEQDFTRPWTEAAKLFFPSSGHLALRWESRQLLELSTVFGKLVAQEVASSTASFWLKSSAAASAATSSLAAMAVAWPVWIISAMANLDNTWLVCIERARVAGRCLAHALADRQTVGQRPVTLVGHSIGARLLVYCLLELYRMGEFHAVDDVVLLGTPVTTRLSKWQKVRAVVSGRVVNGYLGSDWVLAFLYRYLEWGLSVAGLTEVQVPGVENVNLAGLGITGHHDYPRHILNVMARMRVGERGPPSG